MINKINFLGNIHLAKHLKHTINKKDMDLIKSFAHETKSDVFVNSKKRINLKRNVYNVTVIPQNSPQEAYSDFIDTQYPELYKGFEENE